MWSYFEGSVETNEPVHEFPTMWYFDKCKLKRACVARFYA